MGVSLLDAGVAVDILPYFHVNIRSFLGEDCVEDYFIPSRTITALQRIFCPLLLADISHNSSVYCIIVTINASFL